MPEALGQEHLCEYLFAIIEVEVPQLLSLQAQAEAGGEDRAGAGASDQVKAVTERGLAAGDGVELGLDCDQRLGRD